MRFGERKSSSGQGSTAHGPVTAPSETAPLAHNSRDSWKRIRAQSVNQCQEIRGRIEYKVAKSVH
jgi:hypothetical protein